MGAATATAAARAAAEIGIAVVAAPIAAAAACMDQASLVATAGTRVAIAVASDLRGPSAQISDKARTKCTGVYLVDQSRKSLCWACAGLCMRAGSRWPRRPSAF